MYFQTTRNIPLKNRDVVSFTMIFINFKYFKFSLNCFITNIDIPIWDYVQVYNFCLPCAINFV